MERIVSGGQTGVDRAALDVAMEFGVACGGWCPRGRAAEDGAISHRYPLRETPSRRPEQRTHWNVRDSDGTLILAGGAWSGGTALTRSWAVRLGRPHLLIDPDDPAAVARIQRWLEQHDIRVLNVAGPRENGTPGIGAAAAALLRRLLQSGAEPDQPDRS